MAFKYHNTVFIGVVNFEDFAIPESVKYGGPQRTVIHKQPGGARQIDVMGDDPDPIEWSGLFLTTDALAKAEEVMAMKKAGLPVQAQWGGGPGFPAIHQQVIIEDFSCVFLSAARIEYKIKCIPIIDGDNAPAAPAAPNLGANIPGGA